MVYSVTDQSTIMLALSGSQPGVVRGVVSFAKSKGWHVIMDPVLTGSIPPGWRGAGIIIDDGMGEALFAEAAALRIPCVALSTGPTFASALRVENDNAAIGVMAAEHFMERGYRHFAWAPFSNDPQNQQRGDAYKQRLSEYGHGVIDLSPAHVWQGHAWVEDWASRKLRVLDEVSALPKGTALFAHNDYVASDLLRICVEAGIRVPGDVAILGVGNDPALSQLNAVTLSSIDPDWERMGFMAAETLEILFKQPAIEERVQRVPPKDLVPRLSSGIPYVTNERLRKASAYIQENYMNPTLGVLDVAAAVGLSRRTLERQFRLELGVTIAEQIAATRMREAGRILQRHERAKMADVTNLVGFGRQENFFRTFRRHFGMSPKTYRNQMARPGKGATVDG